VLFPFHGALLRSETGLGDSAAVLQGTGNNRNDLPAELLGSSEVDSEIVAIYLERGEAAAYSLLRELS
jgi:hypothetical protein